MMWLIGIVIIVLIVINIKPKKNNAEIQRMDIINQERKRFMEKNNIPSTTDIIYCIKENNNDIQEEIRIWQDTNYLNIISANYDLNNMKLKEKLSIPLGNIKYYNRLGDYRVDNIVEGGGVNLTGAIVGGVIAGGAGAIVGGRKKVTTTTKEVDERQTYLYYLENNELKYISFNSDAYNILLKMFPLKEYSVVNN